jgi:hypothetical protein
MGGYNMKRYFLTLLQKIRGYFTRFDIDIQEVQEIDIKEVEYDIDIQEVQEIDIKEVL